MKVKKLFEIADIDISGVDKKIKNSEISVKLCNYTDVYYNWSIRKDDTNKFMTATANDNEILKFSLKKDNIAITKDSETREDIGMATYITDDLLDTLLGYHCALITPKKNEIDSRYLNAYFHTKTARKYFSNQASGSGQRYTLTKDGIGNVKVPIVPLSTQKAIGQLLSTIDFKMNLNNKINAELEKLAKELYEYWFVQFDFPDENNRPYKSSGGKMVYNEILKREIPTGWEVKKLSDLVIKNNIKTEKNLKKRLIDLSIMPRNTFCLNCFNAGDSLNSNLFELNKYDILFGSIRPYLRKVGFAPFDGIVTGTIHSLRPIRNVFFNFILLSLSHESMFNYVISASKGTKMPVIGYDELVDFSIPFQEKVVENFDCILNFKEIISKNIQENFQLVELRDFLLPLLMNGQVIIKD